MTPTRRVAVAGIALLAAAIGAYASGVLRTTATASAMSFDPDIIALVPIAVDPSQTALLDLRDAMEDLMAAELPGGDGAPRAVRSQIGAGYLLRSEISGTPNELTIHAVLGSAPDGVARARARVRGSADMLPHLAEALIAHLLADQAARDSAELSAMIATSPSALRAYLAGIHAHRRGRGGTPSEAKDHFERAFSLDSSFPLAGLRMVETTPWGMPEADERWKLDAVWNQRNRLGPADRAVLEAYLGSAYPRPATPAELISLSERATSAASHRIESWRIAARTLFHFGPMIGYPSWEARAGGALRRAFAFDSTDAVTLQYLLRLATSTGDTAAVRRYSRLFLAHNPGAYETESVRWLAAVMLGDSAALASMRKRMESLHSFQLRAMIEWSPTHGVGLDDADRASRVYERRATSVEHHRAVIVGVVPFLLNRGRPREASRLLARAERGFGHRADVGVLEFQIYAALYWDGDSSDAAVAARSLEAYLGGAPVRLGHARDRQTASCALAHWRLAANDLTGADVELRRMRAIKESAASVTAESTPVCVAAVEAQLATLRGEPNAGVMLERLDSLLGPGYDRRHLVPSVATLIAARLYEARGDFPRALALTQRRNLWGNHLLATQLRQEGHLAALLGDRVGAVRAFRRYLVLRSDPEPELRAQSARVQAELSRLEKALE